MAKYQKGKRRASKKEKRQLKKKHQADAPAISDYTERITREKIDPIWEEAKKRESELAEKLPKRERRMLQVQRVLGVIPDIRKVYPMPPIVEVKNKVNPSDLDQQAFNERRKKKLGDEDGDVPMTEAASASSTPAPQKESKKKAAAPTTEEKPEIYDLWENAKPSRKRNKQPKKPIASATRLLNTIVPHPGQSYNPDIGAYHDALSRAARNEARKALVEQRIAKHLNPDSGDPNVLSGGHDAYDGLIAQQRALEQEKNVTEDILLERARIAEELRKLHEKRSEQNPQLTHSQLIGRKIHAIQLSRKQRKMQAKFQKKKTFAEELDETGKTLEKMEKREERRITAKRRLRELQHSRAFASVVDARDVFLPEEMPTRLSNMGQNTKALMTAQLRSLKGLKKSIV